MSTFGLQLRRACLRIILAFGLLLGGSQAGAQPSDPDASPQAWHLWDRLLALGQADRFAFGQQNANVYGLNANGTIWTSNGNSNTNRSDIKSVTGRHPALFGFNPLEVATYAGYPSNYPECQPWLERAELRNRIQDAHRWGGLITLYWPLKYLVHTNAWVTPASLAEAQTNGLYYASLTNHLRQLADFLDLLRDDLGQPIPFVFRPWHEYTGGWFWWSVDNTATSRQQFIALFRLTVDYLRQRGHHSFLVALSPSGHRLGVDRDFFHAYPGDEYVDVYAVDQYFCADRDFADQQGGYAVSTKNFFAPAQFWQAVNLTAEAVLSKRANGITKLLAIAEFGAPDGIWGNPKLTAQTSAGYYYDLFLAGLTQNVPLERRQLLSYAMTWRNGSSTHGWIPTGGHAGAADLVNFGNDPRVVLLADNQPPLLAPLPDITLAPNLRLKLPLHATDPDVPPQYLRFSLLNAPTGASLDATNGWFIWQPSASDASTTNLVRVRVTDNGIPAMSATQSFAIVVAPPETTMTVALQAGAWALNGAVLDTNYTALGIRIFSNSPNLSDTTNLISGNQYNSGGARLHRSLLAFDLSKIADMVHTNFFVVHRAELVMVSHAINLGPGINGIAQNLRLTTPFSAGATWNTTDGTNPWPTAGGTVGTLLSNPFIGETGTQTWPSSSNFVAAVTSALASTNPILHLLVKGAYDSNQDNRSQFRGVTWTNIAERPSLVVTFSLASPPPPRLTLQSTGGSVEITWPPSYTGYTLQRQDGVFGFRTNPIFWLAVPGVVSNRYSEPISHGGAFFRLRQP